LNSSPPSSLLVVYNTAGNTSEGFKVNNLNAEASASGEDDDDDIDWEEG